MKTSGHFSSEVMDEFWNREAMMDGLAPLGPPALGVAQADLFAGPHQTRAMQIVRNYVKSNLEKTDPGSEFDIYIVWFTYTLGYWKALISTTLPDGMYYEVTHNHHKKCTYLDAYKKFANMNIPDSSMNVPTRRSSGGGSQPLGCKE